MPQTTRQIILDYLKRHGTVSSREIAGALQMTPANARYHLGILASDGRVKVISRRQISKGRPEKVYQLAGTLMGNNLAELAEVFLMEANGRIRMEALGIRLAKDRHKEGEPLMDRMAATVEHLNAMNYHSHWEAGAEGPRVILGNCPYSAIIESHPELCQMDRSMLKTMLDRDVEQEAKLEKGAGGKPYCLFLVK